MQAAAPSGSVGGRARIASFGLRCQSSTAAISAAKRDILVAEIAGLSSVGSRRRMGPRQHRRQEHSDGRGRRDRRSRVSEPDAGAGTSSYNCPNNRPNLIAVPSTRIAVSQLPRSSAAPRTRSRGGGTDKHDTTCPTTRHGHRTGGQERPRDRRAAPLSEQRTSSICRPTSMSRMRAKAIRSAPPSLHPAACARQEGQRRMRLSPMPDPSSRGSSRRR